MENTESMDGRAAVRAKVPIQISGSQQTAHFYTFKNLCDADEHFVVELGPTEPVPLVRVHSECITGDVFGSRRCDCGPQLDEAIERIGKHGGYIVYLRQEGRGLARIIHRQWSEGLAGVA